jgi:two-component system, cell cycle response regulator DivK
MAGELILVVEDDEKSRRLVHDVLEYEGYRIAEATAGDEGVRLAKELRPVLILMDVQLPGLDGIAALRLLREDPDTRAIPVVAVTASAMPDDRLKIGAAGFDGHQRKPIRIRELVSLVRRLVESGRTAGATDA